MEANHILTERAKKMRKAPTAAEAALWKALRRGKLQGLKFRRQQPIGPYIVDFYCPMARVVVELDGGSHEGKQEYDAKRKAFLESQGNIVLRFGTDIFSYGLDETLAHIFEACKGAAPSNADES